MPSPGPARGAEAWVAIDRGVRDIPAGQTEQFTITVSPPAGLAGGTYPLRLIAYSAKQAPEEFADQARTVEVVLPAAPVPPSPSRRPWWIAAIIAVLVLMIAVALFLVTRQASTPTSTPTPTPPATKTLCRPGLVPRLTRPGDLVCVTPAVANQTAFENNPQVQKARKNDPPGGAYGPDTCRQGFVWRNAFDGDHTCVTGDTRTRTATENQDAAANAGPDAGP
jgi:hypothetical protein